MRLTMKWFKIFGDNRLIFICILVLAIGQFANTVNYRKTHEAMRFMINDNRRVIKENYRAIEEYKNAVVSYEKALSVYERLMITVLEEQTNE